MYGRAVPISPGPSPLSVAWSLPSSPLLAPPPQHLYWPKWPMPVVVGLVDSNFAHTVPRCPLIVIYSTLRESPRSIGTKDVIRVVVPVAKGYPTPNVVPKPAVPLELTPQHFTSPLKRMAQALEFQEVITMSFTLPTATYASKSPAYRPTYSYDAEALPAHAPSKTQGRVFR